MKKVLLTATVQSHICQFHRVLADILHENGYEVHVAARDNLASKNGLKLDFADKVFDVPFSRSPKSTDNLKAYKKLKNIIEENGYDIVHSNTPVGGVITRLAAKGARKKGTKVIYTAHGFHFYKGAPILNWLIYYPVEKILAGITDKLITINREDYTLAKNKFCCDVFHIHGVGANSSKYFVLSDEEKKEIKIRKGYGEDTKLILNVGELLPNKNQKTLICAMEKVVKEFPECKLLIAGNGSEKENIEKLIKEKKLSGHVELLGYTTELDSYMNISRMLVACSFREGLPLNVMEAMMCGKSVIASKNRGHCELIQDGINGYLVDADDCNAFAERICKELREPSIETGNVLSSIIPFTDKNIREELKVVYEL